MATTPAQKRTPRRRASASAAPAVDATVSDAAPEVSAAETPSPAPAAKPARKVAAKPATTPAAKTSPAKKAAQPAAKTRKVAAEADAASQATPAATPATPAPADVSTPARKKAAKPAAKAAKPPASADAADIAADTAADAPADTTGQASAAPSAPAKKPAAKKAATPKPAAKAAPAKKTRAPARQAKEPVADSVPADAPAADSAETDAAPAPARKRGARKPAAAAAAAAVSDATLDSPAAAPAGDEPLAAPAGDASPVTATANDAAETTADAVDAADATAAADDANAPLDTGGDSPADGEPGEPDAAGAPERSRRNRNRRRGRDRDRKRDRGARQPDATTAANADAADAPDEATTGNGSADGTSADAPSEVAVHAPAIAAPEMRAERAAPKAAPAAPAAPVRPPRPAPSGPAHSTLRCVDGDQRQIVWHTGHGASDALFYAALERLGTDGLLAGDDDDSLPRLLRQAGDEGHRVDVEPAVWAQLAARRDARTRAGVLLAAYPDGPASPALAGLLSAPLPLFQAEGALWAVVAGRGLLADERGLGKSVQAIAAAQLWRRHFGVRRVAVISGAGDRLAWQRAWRRFAGVDAQVMEGGHHQRQAAWSLAAEVRILAPEALGSDAAHLAHWAPELVIVDEPQRLALDTAAWAALEQAPQALVLCGAPLDDQPVLLEQLVAWLDRDRLGAYAALREVQAARDGRADLDDAAVERVTDALSRAVLQRQRAEVADQLPPVVYSERIVPLAPAQREAHDRALATLRLALSGWQASGYLSDTDQWRLATTLRAALAACHRADPAVADSPLAESVVQAAADQLQTWAADGAEGGSPQVLLLCETEADQAQLGTALEARGLLRDGVQLALAGAPLTQAADVVLQVGAPWRTRRSALLPRDAAADAVPGQQWLLLVGQDSLEAALFDTLATRTDAPRGAADPGSRGFLQGERLLAWLQAIQDALQAMPASVPSVGGAG